MASGVNDVSTFFLATDKATAAETVATPLANGCMAAATRGAATATAPNEVTVDTARSLNHRHRGWSRREKWCGHGI